MTERISPTIHLRRLGAELRGLREAAGITGDETTGRLGWYSAKVSKIETGRIAPSWGDVADLLDVYGVYDEEVRSSLIRLARQARQQGWWRAYSDVLSRSAATFIGLESAAASLRAYEPLVLPSLLQTESYAWATVSHAPGRKLGYNKIERHVDLRRRRQAVIHSENPLSLDVVIGETALRTGPGDRAVMAEQLSHLIECAQRPAVALRILPRRNGYPGTHGAFGIFRFPDPRDHDVAYAETVAGVVYLERKEDLSRAADVFSHVRCLALEPGQSLEVIRDAAQRATVAA
jgi:transcriptional regulator with XRE-family HTH domain